MFDKSAFQREIEEARSSTEASDPVLAAKRRRGLELVVEAQHGQSLAQVSALLHLLCSHFVVKPLVPDAATSDGPAPPSWTDAVFVATIAGVAFDDVAIDAWDLAHAARVAGGFRKVVPELPVVALATPPDTDDALAPLGGGSDPTYAPGWEHEVMRIPQAWDEIRRHNRAPGTNVVIGHPDYGWMEHEIWDHGNLHPGATNTMEHELRSNPQGIDPYTGPQKGHGLATASVMVAPLTEPRRALTGVAPASVVLPIRCVETVILHPTQGEVAAAIRHAIRAGCRVISLSLGGYFLGLSNLRSAIQEAIAANIIVVAASGNYLWWTNSYVTVEPASWAEVIGVGGIEKTNQGYRRWGHSGRNPLGSITISAPAYPILRAVPRASKYETSEGTSYATAFVAGVAALWLSCHFPHSYPSGGMRAQDCFKKYLRLTMSPTAIPASEADAHFIGVVNAEALMKTIPDTTALLAADEPLTAPSAVREVERLLGTADTAATRSLLAGALHTDDDDALEAWAAEIEFMLLRDPDLGEQLARHRAAGMLTPATLQAILSPRASAALRHQFGAIQAV